MSRARLRTMSRRQFLRASVVAAAGAATAGALMGTLTRPVLAGAASRPVAPKAEGAVNIICFAGEVATAIRALSQDFMKEQPGIQINLEEVDFATAEKKMWLDFASQGGAYDIVIMLNFWFGRAMKQGNLRAIDDYIQKDTKPLNLEDYAPPVLGTTQQDGKNYGFPVQAGDKLLYYRVDKFQEAGLQPPATWKDLLAAAKALHHPDQEFYGAAPWGKSPISLAWAWAQYVHSEGEDLFAADMRPLIDQPASVQYLEYLQELFKYGNPGAEAQADDEGTNVFLTGKAGILEQWGDVGPRVFDPKQTTLKPEQVGYAPIPKGNGPKARLAPFFAMWSSVLSAYAKNPDAAYEFMSWLSLKDKEFLLLGGIPCRNSTYSDPELVAKYPHLKVIGDTMPYARSLPSFPEWAEISNAIGTPAQKVIIGEMQPAEAVKQAHQDTDAILRRAGYYS